MPLLVAHRPAPLTPPPPPPAVFVNGGMISTLFLGTKLYEHRRALKAERQLQRKVKVKKDE